MAQTPYLTLSQVKYALNISNTQYDNFINQLIPQVQSFIDEYTGRSFGWGDTGDSALTDYSNSDNIGIQSFTYNSSTGVLDIIFMGPVPWVVGSSVALSSWTVNQFNGVFTVATLNYPTEITINVGTGLSTPTTAGVVRSNVSNYINRLQETHDGLVGKIFHLKQMDIRSISHMWIGLRNLAQPVELDPSQYVWHKSGRVILGGAYFNSYDSAIFLGGNDNSFYGTVAAGYETIMVDYYHGYIGVPQDISMAAINCCIALFKLPQLMGVIAEQIGYSAEYRIQNDPNFLTLIQGAPDVIGHLGRYRRFKI